MILAVLAQHRRCRRFSFLQTLHRPRRWTEIARLSTLAGSKSTRSRRSSDRVRVAHAAQAARTGSRDGPRKTFEEGGLSDNHRLSGSASERRRGMLIADCPHRSCRLERRSPPSTSGAARAHQQPGCQRRAQDDRQRRDADGVIKRLSLNEKTHRLSPLRHRPRRRCRKPAFREAPSPVQDNGGENSIHGVSRASARAFDGVARDHGEPCARRMVAPSNSHVPVAPCPDASASCSTRTSSAGSPLASEVGMHEHHVERPLGDEEIGEADRLAVNVGDQAERLIRRSARPAGSSRTAPRH